MQTKRMVEMARSEAKQKRSFFLHSLWSLRSTREPVTVSVSPTLVLFRQYWLMSSCSHRESRGSIRCCASVSQDNTMALELSNIVCETTLYLGKQARH
jgi:hypothetical protein